MHVHSCPLVHSSFRPEPFLLFLHAQSQVVDSESKWILLEHELASHGFGVSFDAVMFKRLREQVSAVVTAFDVVVLQRS